jgi:fructose-1-phosphate kinase PfkB-like protein
LRNLSPGAAYGLYAEGSKAESAGGERRAGRSKKALLFGISAGPEADQANVAELSAIFGKELKTNSEIHANACA